MLKFIASQASLYQERKGGTEIEKKKVKVKEKVETFAGVQVGVRAPRGSKLTCKSWQTEAAMRMLMTNLDPSRENGGTLLTIFTKRFTAISDGDIIVLCRDKRD